MDNPTSPQGSTEPKFVREERYIVIKRKHLTPYIERIIRDQLTAIQVPIVDAVVVEKRWPEYETIWKLIEERVTGKDADRTYNDWSTDSLISECRAQAASQLDPGFTRFMLALASRLSAHSAPQIISDHGVALARIADAIEVADNAFGYQIKLTGLVDGVSTYTLTYADGTPPLSFDNYHDASDHTAERRSALRAEAALRAITANGGAA